MYRNTGLVGLCTHLFLKANALINDCLFFGLFSFCSLRLQINARDCLGLWCCPACFGWLWLPKCKPGVDTSSPLPVGPLHPTN